MNIRKKLPWVGAPALLVASMSASAGWVDLFTTAQVASDVTNANGGVTSFVSDVTPPLSILGNERDILVNAISGASDDFGVAGVCDSGDKCSQLSISGGLLNFSNTSPVVGEALVQWDGVDGNIALNPVGIGTDLTEGGTISAFQYTITNSDANWAFGLNVYSSANQWTKVILAATEVVPGTPETRQIQFASLSNVALCGHESNGTGTKNLGFLTAAGVLSVQCGSGNTAPVNFANFGAMEIALNVASPVNLPVGCTTNCFLAQGAQRFSLDLEIGGINTVPEPSILGLMGIGLLAGGLASRRRKASA